MEENAMQDLFLNYATDLNELRETFHAPARGPYDRIVKSDG